MAKNHTPLQPHPTVQTALSQDDDKGIESMQGTVIMQNGLWSKKWTGDMSCLGVAIRLSGPCLL